MDQLIKLEIERLEDKIQSFKDADRKGIQNVPVHLFVEEMMTAQVVLQSLLQENKDDS